MEDQESSENRGPHPDEDPLPVGRLPSADSPIEPVAPSPTSPVAQQNIAPTPPDNQANNPNPLQVSVVNESLTVRAIEDDELSNFERRTLNYARAGLIIAVITFVIAFLTGWIFLNQLKEFSEQTDVLELGAKQARIDAKNAAVVTEGSLKLLNNRRRYCKIK
jgi:hypothetical protein